MCGAFPARAGMARRSMCAASRTRCVPRPRGDGPASISGSMIASSRSPPARGWPDIAFGFDDRALRVPRPRGDGPSGRFRRRLWTTRSPPARGWPVGGEGAAPRLYAFPARAGMARHPGEVRQDRRRVPRPRGDGPAATGCRRRPARRSPPARGWPGRASLRATTAAAFPARAGMARSRRCGRPGFPGVPRPRGDGPILRSMFLSGFSRSPPARGWPGIPQSECQAYFAFPARAGMARRRSVPCPESQRVPRPRGDGPFAEEFGRKVVERSPPARGWPGMPQSECQAYFAFPARAGMARPLCPATA